MAYGDTILTAAQGSLESAAVTTNGFSSFNVAPDGWLKYNTPDTYLDGSAFFRDTTFINATNGTQYVRLRELDGATYEEGIYITLDTPLLAGNTYEFTIDAASASSITNTTTEADANTSTLAIASSSNIADELGTITVVSTPTEPGLKSYTLQFIPSADVTDFYILNKEDTSSTSIDDSLFVDNVQITDITPVVVCFTSGCMIETAEGEVAVEELQVGDLVRTYDRGYQPIRFIYKSELKPFASTRPVRFKKGAIGNTEEFMVSQQHRFLVSELPEKLQKGSTITNSLIKAIEFVDGQTVEIVNNLETVTYFHIMLDEHELLYCHGTVSESWQPHRRNLSRDKELSQELLAIFPEIRNKVAKPARPEVMSRPWREFKKAQSEDQAKELMQL